MVMATAGGAADAELYRMVFTDHEMVCAKGDGCGADGGSTCAL